jgi:hypothetical protein
MSTTNTATVRVILKAVMSVVVRRTRRLRKLYFKGMAMDDYSLTVAASSPRQMAA